MQPPEGEEGDIWDFFPLIPHVFRTDKRVQPANSRSSISAAQNLEEKNTYRNPIRRLSTVDSTAALARCALARVIFPLARIRSNYYLARKTRFSLSLLFQGIPHATGCFHSLPQFLWWIGLATIPELYLWPEIFFLKKRRAVFFKFQKNPSVIRQTCSHLILCVLPSYQFTLNSINYERQVHVMASRWSLCIFERGACRVFVRGASAQGKPDGGNR